MRLEGPCPACHRPTLEYTAADMDLPHFGGVTQLVFECESCGFRHSDFLIGRSREPTRYSLVVSDVQGVMVRVVRSTSGTVRIPELGVLIEPGPASDAYVSNIEGVLTRVRAVLIQLCRDAETQEQRVECQRRLADLEAAIDGRFRFTFILEDPYGNSALIHDDVKIEPIEPEEAAHLKTGEITLSLTESVPPPVSPNGGGHANGGGQKD